MSNWKTGWNEDSGDEGASETSYIDETSNINETSKHNEEDDPRVKHLYHNNYGDNGLVWDLFIRRMNDLQGRKYYNIQKARDRLLKRLQDEEK